MRTIVTLPILLLVAAAAFAEDPFVVLASTHAGRIEAFDSGLGRLGAIGVNEMLEGISASPDGHTLYIAQEQRGECCSLYTLDMESHKMCPFGPFVLSATMATVAPDGNSLYVQDSRGVQIYDTGAKRASYYAPMHANAAYNLQPSPDGKWLLGIANSDGAFLDVFDLKTHALSHRIEIPIGPATGAWVGESYHIFSYAGYGKGQLWNVKPEDTKLAEPKLVQLPDLHGGCDQPVLLMLAGGKDRLFLAEAFGYKMDRRSACPGAAPGGIYAIDPSTGQARHIAPSIRVNRMVVTPDGRDLYVTHSSGPAHQGDVRLIHLDADGHTMSNVTLESGDWNLTLTHTPASLIPRGYLRAALSCYH